VILTERGFRTAAARTMASMLCEDIPWSGLFILTLQASRGEAK
jgi:hypothetical protein